MIIESIIDMTLGMIIGMGVSPLMMKLIKTARQKRRVNKILHEISELRTIQ
jgi:hypothetical protein